MKRRAALFGIVGIGVGLAYAQPATKARVIGLLDGGKRMEWWAVFRDQLQKLGYVVLVRADRVIE